MNPNLIISETQIFGNLTFGSILKCLWPSIDIEAGFKS